MILLSCLVCPSDKGGVERPLDLLAFSIHQTGQRRRAGDRAGEGRAPGRVGLSPAGGVTPGSLCDQGGDILQDLPLPVIWRNAADALTARRLARATPL